MVATRGWERLGFARLADYAVERAGMSARELRDLAHVDGALAALPRVEQAFLAGDLGWTQVRLVCRAAQPKDECEWLALASHLTASDLAREVRDVDQRARNASARIDLPDELDERRAGVVVRCTPAVRARWWHARQVAHRVAGHRLSVAGFMEAVTAEVLSAVGLEGEPPPEDVEPMQRDERAAEARGTGSHPAPDGKPHETGANAKSVPRHMYGREDTTRAAVPDPSIDPPEFVGALTRDLETADAFELDARLRRAVRLEARRLAHLAARLEHVVVLGLPRALGFSRFDAYAEDRLGIAPSRARALLRIARAASECPTLGKAFATGRVSWVQAHALIPLLFEPAAARHRATWVRFAERVSVRRLSEEIERALATGEFAPPSIAQVRCSGDATHLQIGAITRLRTEDPPRPERVRLFFSAPLEVAQLFRAALAIVQRRLEHLRRRPASQGEALAAMLAHAVDTWITHDPRDPTPRDRRVFERDGWRCTVPGCSSYRNLHGHHIVFRSHRGSDAQSNLTTLCAWHHQRGIHGSGLRASRVVSCTGRAPHALHFALGLRPQQPPLLAYGPGEVRMA